jgi:hypothetical protein
MCYNRVMEKPENDLHHRSFAIHTSDTDKKAQ